MNRIKASLCAVTGLPVVALAILTINSMLPCQGFGSLSRTFDYIIDIETSPDPSQFEYAGSAIGPVVMASVSYHKPDCEESEVTRYEKLWYHDWQALGCRRQNALDLGGTSQVAIEVKHKGGSPAQSAAAANATLRIILDVFSKRSSVATIIVPDDDMQAFGMNLARAGFRMEPEPPPEVPITCPMSISIQAKNSGFRQMLFYFPR